jgi:hypothetical protein
MKKITILFLVSTLISFSCLSKEEEKINSESLLVFQNSVLNINQSGYEINIDSFKTVYENHKSLNPQDGLEFAKRFETYSENLLIARREADSLENDRQLRKRALKKEVEIEKQKEWDKSKPGKLQKKYPSWTKEESIKIANNEIWIGMKFEMLKHMRGLPNHANESNYGNGVKYQWCWSNYTTSCFYGDNNGIITAYN